MNYAQFLNLQWKETLRSKAFKSNWGMKILTGFLVLYFGSAFLLLGFFMPEIIEDSKSAGETVVGAFSGGMLYYTLIDIVMRYFLQDLNVLKIQHYLILPVSKKRVLNYFLRSSVFNFFNLIPLFFTVPFAFRAIIPAHGVVAGIAWLVATTMLFLTNHFLAYYLKRVVAVQAKIFIAVAVVIAALLVGDALDWFSLHTISKTLYQPMAIYPWMAFFPVLPLLVLYRVNYRFLLQFTYLDRWQAKAAKVSSRRFTFLENQGLTGTLMANELKLILRNKRTKQVLISVFLLAFYGLIFYASDQYGITWHLFAGIFMTGVGAINYGQFLTSWESAYFDGILTRAVSIRQYYVSKFWLLAASTILMYLITLPYAFFGLEAFYVNTAAFIYNLGVNIFVILFASTYNKKAIDLGKGSSFNYQGTSATQFIIIIPLLIIPLLLFLGFKLLGFPYFGLLFLSGMGIISLLFSKYWMREIVQNFYEKKYIKAAGFREE